MFGRLDPTLAGYYDLMRGENLLDLANRPNKGPGAWCTSFVAARRPYIFMNAVGLHDDVMTLVHESGHAFHWSESYALPYFQQRGLDFIPIEMMEVASMSMEYLTAPYLAEAEGGFYSPQDAARARIEHLEGAILFWPYMAVVDGFQQWAYTHPDDAIDPQKCGAKWTELRQRFEPDIDWTGYEDALANGWQEKVHIFEVPFYYVEYGLAQLGAVQVWRNALADLPGAVARYRAALALGITRPLPQLYAAAGAKFAFDAETLRECVTLMRDTIAQLEGAPV
jgi:oligoendopeptidase F